MNYLQFLKRKKMHYSCRWIVKYNKDKSVREVKLVYNPDEYRNNATARKLHTQKGLIKVLEKNKEQYGKAIL